MSRNRLLTLAISIALQGLGEAQAPPLRSDWSQVEKLRTGTEVRVKIKGHAVHEYLIAQTSSDALYLLDPFLTKKLRVDRTALLRHCAKDPTGPFFVGDREIDSTKVCGRASIDDVLEVRTNRFRSSDGAAAAGASVGALLSSACGDVRCIAAGAGVFGVIGWLLGHRTTEEVIYEKGLTGWSEKIHWTGGWNGVFADELGRVILERAQCLEKRERPRSENNGDELVLEFEQAHEGGFELISGEPGTEKCVTLTPLAMGLSIHSDSLRNGNFQLLTPRPDQGQMPADIGLVPQP